MVLAGVTGLELLTRTVRELGRTFILERMLLSNGELGNQTLVNER